MTVWTASTDGGELTSGFVAGGDCGTAGRLTQSQKGVGKGNGTGNDAGGGIAGTTQNGTQYGDCWAQAKEDSANKQNVTAVCLINPNLAVWGTCVTRRARALPPISNPAAPPSS